MDLAAYATDLGRQARAAARILATASAELRDRWLRTSAAALEEKTRQVVAANGDDLAAAEEALPKAEERLKGETQLYEVEHDRKSVHLTHEGIKVAQGYAGVGSFYIGANMDWPHLLEQSLRAHIVYRLDKEYVVERDPHDGEMSVIIVDEFTGRKMVGHNVVTGYRVRAYPELLGLRQADPSSQQAGAEGRQHRDRDSPDQCGSPAYPFRDAMPAAGIQGFVVVGARDERPKQSAAAHGQQRW